MSVRARLAVVVLWFAALLEPLGAQQRQSLELEGPSGSERIHCDLAAYSGTHNPGGYGWARVTLTNPNDRAKRVDLSINNPGIQLFSSRARVMLEPGTKRTVFLPSPAMASLRVEVDGTAWEDPTNSHPMWGGTSGGLTVGVIGRAAGSAASLQIISLTPEDLPDRWWLLSTLNGIVLGGISDAASLSPERQAVLADYVAGGGVVIVEGLEVDALPAGPLKTAIVAARAMPSNWAASGLGRYVTKSLGSDWATLIVTAGRPGSQPMHGLLDELPIPTIDDEVPVGMFMTLLVLFALVVGIQALVLLRSKRGVLLLCTIPATGLGLSAIVLAYGFFGQGLGIQGVIRSFTILDQRSHRAVSLSQRSLFAGLSPGRTVIGDTTLVANDDGRMAFELGGEVAVSGSSLLRPRRTTTIGSVSVGPARERLRFRKLADGSVSCITDGVLAIVPDAVVLRDFEGNWYSGGQNGVLRPCADGTAMAWTVHQRFGDHKPKSRSGDVHAWIASQLSAGLPNGSYLAAVVGTGTIPDFGLDVEWHRADHVVHGLLAPEDFDG